MAAESRIRVEVAFATPERQLLVSLEFDRPATVAEAIERAIVPAFPERSLAGLQAGIWGKPVPRSQRLTDGDRVELYRPLERDPRQARRALAAAGKDRRTGAPRSGSG